MSNESESSEYLYKTPCDSCSSSDALAVYSDGHTFCFSCSKWEAGSNSDGASKVSRKEESFNPSFIDGICKALPSRSISEETCSKFGYQVGKDSKGKNVQVANYYKDGVKVAQHTRDKDKDFKWLGESKGVELFGQHLWREGGKMVTITEGEIDAMSVSQLQNNKWPVVSLPSGINGAVKALKANLEWLERYDSIVLMFDNDPPGTQAAEAVAKAVQDCASLFTPGKCKVARLPLKDANEMLCEGRGGEVIQAIWDAKEYRPDGLVGIDDLLAELYKPIVQGLPWFLGGLTELTFGRRYGEVYGFGAGTGIGKTDLFTQQIEYDIFTLDQKVGLIFLEQQPTETVVRIAGKHVGKRLHVPDGSWTIEERNAAVERLRGKVVLYNSFGQTDWDVIAAKINYMAVSEGIRLFYFDHLTATADTSNERESLEQTMKEMAGLAMRLQIIIHFVSHLATPEGKPHEEGGRVSIKHFKGSRSIGFWSYFMFGLERDQQSDDPIARSITTLRVLKDRFTGQATGKLLFLKYDGETGRLYESSEGIPESNPFATSSPDNF